MYLQEGKDKKYLISLLKKEKDEIEALYKEHNALKHLSTESNC